MTTRNELRERLTKHKRRHETVDVGGGEEYVIRSLTLREQGENDMLVVNAKTQSVDMGKIGQQKCELLCLSVVESVDGEPLFDRSEWKVWEEVDSGVAVRLLRAIEKLNGAEAVKELVKNSAPTGD